MPRYYSIIRSSSFSLSLQFLERHALDLGLALRVEDAEDELAAAPRLLGRAERAGHVPPAGRARETRLLRRLSVWSKPNLHFQTTRCP